MIDKQLCRCKLAGDKIKTIIIDYKIVEENGADVKLALKLKCPVRDKLLAQGDDLECECTKVFKNYAK